MKSSIVIGLVFFCLLILPYAKAQQVPRSQKEVQNQISTFRDTLRAYTSGIDTLRTRTDTLRIDTLRAKAINGNSTLEQIEIDRLIIDETISKAGYEFLDLFNTLWVWPEPSTESFIMVITERPYRGISTQIVITINELVVFESFLQTRYDYLEYMAGLAVEQATGYVLSYVEIIKQLEGVDTKGTGIY